MVPAGTPRLDVAIGNTSDLGADLDLYVRLNGVEVARAADGDSEEAVSIANPAPGTYEVDVDGFAIPSGQHRSTTTGTCSSRRRSGRSRPRPRC